jgi:hypothetical protein
MARAKNIALMFAVAFIAIGLLLTLNLSTYEATARKSKITASAKLEVYSDQACTQSLTSIDWGTVSIGDSVTKTFYIKNQGRHPLKLSLITTNWNPNSAHDLLVINWNREGATLAAGRTASATLTLSASPSASDFTTFGVNVVIFGEKYRNYS